LFGWRWFLNVNRDYEAPLLFRSGFHLGMQLVAEALSNPPELYEE
jgi:hypothetical protein